VFVCLGKGLCQDVVIQVEMFVCLDGFYLGLAGTVIKAPTSQAREGRPLSPFLARLAERVQAWASFPCWGAARSLLPRDGGISPARVSLLHLLL